MSCLISAKVQLKGLTVVSIGLLAAKVIHFQLPLCLWQMLCDVDEVMAIRMILRQPSPVWLHFTIEELQIYPRGQEVGAFYLLGMGQGPFWALYVAA